MCNDDTEAENTEYLERQLHRREWSVGAGAVMASLLAACGRTSAAPAEQTVAPEQAASEPVKSAQTATKSRMVTVDTLDGAAEALFVTPSEGRHPAVLIWPDIAGLRDAFIAMATRLASQGYAVLAVNQYYRSSQLPILTEFSQWRTEEGQAKIRPMAEELTPVGIMGDAVAFVAWLDQQPEVDTDRKIGTTGYCMGGPFTFRTAAAAPSRVGVLGSFHGGGLVTKDGDSPHELLPQIKAAALVCVAQNDHERQPTAKPTLEEAAKAANVHAEIEVYAAQHGWCVTDSPVYDEPEAERAWGRLLATLDAHL